MSINLKELFNEACDVTLVELKDSIKKRFVKFLGEKTNLYFYDKHDIQRLKDNPHHAKMRGIDVNDPDLGLVTKMIDDHLADQILGEDIKLYMKQYMDGNFQRHLNEAMDKAMRHKAHAIAFKEITKVGGAQRAAVVLSEVLDFLSVQGRAVSSYRSGAESDHTFIRLPYPLDQAMIDRFAIAFPNCKVEVEERGTTTLKVFYDEHVNAQA